MYCPRCGTNNIERARFCARCGAPLTSTSGQRQATPARPAAVGAAPTPTPTAPQGRRPRRVLPIVVGVVLVSLVAVGALIGFRMLGSGTPEQPWEKNVTDPYYTEEGDLLCGIRLQADRTHAYVGDEDGSVTLTLAVPEYVDEGRVRVVDVDGGEIAALDINAMEDAGDGWRTVELDYAMDTSKDGVTGLMATAGQYYSPELDFYVTPHITADQVADCAIVSVECSEAMQKSHANDTNEERAKAAQKWLEADERVASSYLEDGDTTVWFVTTDSVGGAYEATVAPHPGQNEAADITGIDDGRSDISSDGLTSQLYKSHGLEEMGKNDRDYFNAKESAFTRSSAAVAMNPNALFLQPISVETIYAHYDWDETENNLAADRTGHYYALEERSLGQLASAMGGSRITKAEDEAVRWILNKRINEYGFVVLHTHGNYEAFVGQAVFELYRSEAYTSDTKNQLREDARTKLMQYSRMAYESDSQGFEGQPLSFYDEFFTDFTASNGVVETFSTLRQSKYRGHVILESTASNPGHYELKFTSGYFRSRYQDQLFDNTIVYLATCHGIEDRAFNEWLLNHGCRSVMGFRDSVDGTVATGYLGALVRAMKEDSSNHSNRWRTLGEALQSIGQLSDSVAYFIQVAKDFGLSGPSAQTWARHSSSQWFGSTGALDNAATCPQGMTDSTLYYVGDPDFCFAGSGTLTGRVVWQDVDGDGHPLPGVEPEPADGAIVRAYHLFNRKFVPLDDKEVTAASDGTFTMPELPLGHLILIAEASEESSDPYQLYLVDSEWNGGDIVLKRHEPTVYVYVKDTSGNVVDKATVTLTGDDGKVFKTTLVDRPEGKTFKALVTSQHYEVKVTPDDDHLTEATVELDVPDSEPWSHDVTVTVDNTCTISGLVVDAQTNARLAGVEVGWVGPSGEGFVQTDSDGFYKVEDLAPGEYTLTFKKVGYETEITTVSKNALVEAKNHEVAVPTIKLKPAAAGTAFSGCIGAYGGTTYSIEPVASTLTPLPTACACYDYICTFAFWGDKVYYCCKEAGTAQYHMALYEADLDGSGARELYAPSNPMSLSASFAVSDGTLYYQESAGTYGAGGYATYAMDLATGSRSEAGAVPDDVREFLDERAIAYGEEKVRAGEATSDYGGTDHLLVTHADGSTETFATVGSDSIRLEAVVPMEGEDDAYVYYSGSMDGYRTYDLFRKRLSGGAAEDLGSRPAAGGGGYFAW